MASVKIETLETIAAWRAAAGASAFAEVRVEAENELTAALRHLFAMADEHPELRTIEEFQALARNLEHVEESLRHARRRYNSTVRNYNRRIGVFPGSLLARLLGLRPKPLLDLNSVGENESGVMEPRPESRSLYSG